MKALILDDEPSLCEIIGSVLDETGSEVFRGEHRTQTAVWTR
jgi:hypothetical protein